MSLPELFAKFPDDDTAEAWFVEQRWPDGVHCVFCGSENVAERASRKPQPYRCRSCRRNFSVKTGSLMHASKLGCRVWVLAIYLMSTSVKGVSNLKLHRDLGVTQKTAWYLAHRIRAAWENHPSRSPVRSRPTRPGSAGRPRTCTPLSGVSGSTARTAT